MPAGLWLPGVEELQISQCKFSPSQVSLRLSSVHREFNGRNRPAPGRVTADQWYCFCPLAWFLVCFVATYQQVEAPRSPPAGSPVRQLAAAGRSRGPTVSEGDGKYEQRRLLCSASHHGSTPNPALTHQLPAALFWPSSGGEVSGFFCPPSLPLCVLPLFLLGVHPDSIIWLLQLRSQRRVMTQ